MIVTDLSNSFNPVPKNERKKDKKLIENKKHNCEYCGKKKLLDKQAPHKEQRLRWRRRRG